MKPRHILGAAVAALAIGLLKLWMSDAPEEPAPGPTVNLEELYPAEVEQAMQQKMQRQP